MQSQKQRETKSPCKAAKTEEVQVDIDHYFTGVNRRGSRIKMTDIRGQATEVKAIQTVQSAQTPQVIKIGVNTTTAEAQ